MNKQIKAETFREIPISLSPRKMALTLAIVAISLVIISLASGIHIYLNSPTESLILALFRFTNVDSENSVATYFSILLLILIAVLTLGVARIKQFTDRQYVRRWYLLAAGFFYLSMDEALSIHEWVGNLIRESQETSGVFTHAWVIPAIPIGIVFFALYGRLLFALPQLIRNNLLAGLAVYVFGTILLEMAGGYFLEIGTRDDPTVRGLQHVEELGEMLGAILIIYGLLSYLSLKIKLPVVINLQPAEPLASIRSPQSE